jgi:hypothetical protein
MFYCVGISNELGNSWAFIFLSGMSSEYKNTSNAVHHNIEARHNKIIAVEKQ